MRILIINHYAGSLKHGMEYRPYYFAREWIKKGHTVDIIAADYSHLRIRNPSIIKDFQTEQIDDITYNWVKTGVYSKNGIKRAMTMFCFVTKLFFNKGRIASELKPDVVISSSTYPLDTFASYGIAKAAHAKLIHEVHDMWPLTLIEKSGFSKYHPFVVIMQIAENFAYKHSDAVVSLLPNTKEHMVRHGLREDKFYHIPNGIASDDWNNCEELPYQLQKVIDELKAKKKFLVCYFGGHAKSNALSYFVEAAKYLPSDIQLLLVGHGVEKNNLIKYANENKLENVTFLPSISKKAIPSLLRQIDLIYIGVAPSRLYRFGISLNKMYDSMMAGKPILASMDVANNDVVDHNCGIVVKPGDANAIAEGICTIMKMTDKERKTLGDNGKSAAIKHYDYKKLADRFGRIFSQ